MRAFRGAKGRLPRRSGRVWNALSSLLAIQAVMALAIAAGFYMYRGAGGAVAALYGGAIALVVSALLAFRLARAARPGAGMLGLYLSTFERFLFVGVAFGLGIGVLKLAAVPLLAGFMGAEVGYFLAAGAVRGGGGTGEG